MVKKAAQAKPNSQLRAARKERGWTQQQVADRIGAPLSLNISRWENGTALPSAFYIERLCQLFGKSIRELGLSQLEKETLAEQATPIDQVTASSLPANQQVPFHTETATKVWMLPYLRNPFFLGREEVLARLWHSFQADQTIALHQPQAISGLGGVGKTQVALEYAYRHVEDYQAIFWTRADCRDALAEGYFQIAQTLSLPACNERDQTIMISAVKSWLSHNPNWLLILDNADKLSVLPEFLPAPIHGHLLLTTRAQALGHLAKRVEIEMLNFSLSTLLLLRRAGLLALDAPITLADQIDRQAAELLAWELGGLPLAIDQAGAYLEETRCSLHEYLNLYRNYRTDMLRHRGGVISDHPESVATTLSLSFASVESHSALAADLLRLSAVIHCDSIPEELFLQGSTYLGPTLANIEVDPLAFNHALSVIQNYSLIRRANHEHTLSIHRLVQVVIADAMSIEERNQWIERAIVALNAIFPEVRDRVWGRWEVCNRLLPHVLASTADTAALHESMELATLLTKAADYLLQRAEYVQAEPLYRRALQIDERLLGYENPRLAFPLNGLADLYREQCRFVEAEPLYRRALSLWEQILDQKHSEDSLSPQQSGYSLSRTR